MPEQRTDAKHVESPVRAGRQVSNAKNLDEQIKDFLPQILGRRRGADYRLVGAVIDLAAGKRWTDATNNEIAHKSGVSPRHTERRIPKLVDEGILTDQPADHPAAPATLHSQGRRLAPNRAELERRLRAIGVQPLLFHPEATADRREPDTRPPSDRQTTDTMSVVCGGEGGESARRRQLQLFDDMRIRADRHHAEQAKHVSDTADCLLAELRRLFASLRDEILSALSSLFQKNKIHVHEHGFEKDLTTVAQRWHNRKLLASDFHDATKAHELFEYAERQGWGPGADRDANERTFFNIVAHCQAADNPGRLLTHIVFEGGQVLMSCADEDRGGELYRKWHELQARTRPVNPVVTAVANLLGSEPAANDEPDDRAPPRRSRDELIEGLRRFKEKFQ